MPFTIEQREWYERERRVQYGRCPHGHERAARPVYEDGKYQRLELHCPTCGD